MSRLAVLDISHVYRQMQIGIMKPFHSIDAILEHLLIRHARPSVAVVRQIKMSHSTILGQDHKANDTARATIPLDRLLQSTPHKVDTFLLCHLFPPVGIGITVDVGRARTTDSERLLVKGSSQRYREHLTTVSWVPSGENDTRTIKSISVWIASKHPEQKSTDLSASLFS